MRKKNTITGLRILNLTMLINPVILMGIAIFMKNRFAFQPPSEFYEVNDIMRNVQYFLYLSGLGVFFFIDAINQPIKKRMLKQKDVISHIKFNIISMAILDYIGISGFIGFLISGNLTWVVIFCVIGFFSRLRFVNTYKNIPGEAGS